jgi:hypothetical protein
MMGDILKSDEDAVTLVVDLVGSAPIERLEIRNRMDVLETVRPFADAAALAAWAESPREVVRVLPRLSATAKGVQPVLPGHPAYDEIGKLDPDGRGDVWSEMRAGVAVRIGEHVERITDASGRHAYRVGGDADGWHAIAPGSVHLVEADRIVIAPDRASVPAAMLEAADWLAPAEGFLQPLR